MSAPAELELPPRFVLQVVGVSVGVVGTVISLAVSVVGIPDKPGPPPCELVLQVVGVSVGMVGTMLSLVVSREGNKTTLQYLQYLLYLVS